MPGDATIAGVVPLVLGMRGFIARALDHLHAHGRTRLGMLLVPGHDGEFTRHVLEGLARRGMVTRPHWSQLVSQHAAECARGVAHLLMNPDLEPGQRPDALLISDDNLVEYASWSMRLAS